MGEKAMIFDKQCINKIAFYENKRPINIIIIANIVNIDKVEIKRITLSKKDSSGKKGSFKYFIGFINETDPFPVPCP